MSSRRNDRSDGGSRGGGYGGGGDHRGDRDRGDRSDRQDRNGGGGGGYQGNNRREDRGGQGGQGGGWGNSGASGWNKDGGHNDPCYDSKPETREPPSAYGGASTSYSRNEETPRQYNDFSAHTSKPQPQSGPVVFLANLSYEVCEQDIMAFLEDYQPVRAKLLFTEEGTSKGTGFVELKSAEMAQRAIHDLSMQEWHGRKLVINNAFNQAKP